VVMFVVGNNALLYGVVPQMRRYKIL